MWRLTTARTRCAALAAVLVLGGCAEAELIAHTAKQARDAVEPERAERPGYYKVGNPYQIAGVWYYPKVDYDYVETGIASWYGPGFHGKETANGEIYNQGDLTAAHRTLPMPSVVRVTNLENGRALKLRVNDRGPFARGRIIDVSKRAAELLGFKEQGTAKVRVEVVEADSRRMAAGELDRRDRSKPPEAVPTVGVETASLAPATHGTRDREGTRASDAAPQPRNAPDREPADAGGRSGAAEVTGEVTQVPVADSDIFVQAGAFTGYDNANTLRARLASLGDVRIAEAQVDGRQFFRVQVGPVDDVDAADRLLDKLVANGYTQSRVVVD
jgi:rare lipoprotein A